MRPTPRKARVRGVGLNPLQALIAEHLDRTGETLADVARRGGLSRQTVSGLMNRRAYASAPHAATLRSLAVGLELAPRVVYKAAGESLAPGGDEPPDLALVLLDLLIELPPESIEVLIATARALHRHKRALRV